MDTSFPKEAQCWDCDLVQALDENEAIQGEKLVTESINKVKDILTKDGKNYGADELKHKDMLIILQEHGKGNTLEQCKKTLKTGIEIYEKIGWGGDGYGEEELLHSLLCYWTKDGKTIKLSEDCLATTKKLEPPPCLKLKTLHPDLCTILRQHGNPIKERLIRDEKDIAEKLLPYKLKGWQQADWQRNGWDLLKYAYEHLQEYDLADAPWRVPILLKNWQRAENSFFSGDWGVGKSLENWVKKEKPEERYILASFKDVCKPFAMQKQNDDKESLLAFFIKLGVMAHPKIIPMHNPKNEKSIRRSKPERLYGIDGYKDYCRKIRAGGYGWLNTDFALEGFPDSFCKGSDYKQRCRVAERLVKQLDGNRNDYDAQYMKEQGKKPRPTKDDTDVGCANFALYQLSTYPWVTKDGSFLNSQGNFAPRECYRGTHGVFPCVSGFSPETCDILHIKSKKRGEPYDYPEEVWEEWIEGLADNYTRFLEKEDNKKEEGKNSEKVKIFYEEYFKSPHMRDISGIKVAAYPIGIPKFQFMKKENVFWNDMRMQCDIRQLSGFEDYGLFVLDDRHVDGDTSLFAEFGIRPVSELFDVKPDPKSLEDEKVSQDILERLEGLQWKALIRVLNKSQKEYEFSKLQPVLNFCEKLKLDITKKEGDKRDEPVPTNDHRAKYYREPDSGKAYVTIDTKTNKYRYDNLARFLCDIFFNAKKNQFNHVRAILNTFKREDLDYELEQMGIDPSEVEDKWKLRQGEEDVIKPKVEIRKIRRGGRGGGRVVSDFSGSDESKEIGDAAERWVESWLNQKGKEKVKLIGGNNEGYDIEYQENGITYYVEVKGSKGAWDARMTKPQLEMARCKKERYWLYIVNNVSLDNPESARLAKRIQDPYGKMKSFIIDHSWADDDDDDDSSS